MIAPSAVLFDLAGTLVEWPEDDPERRWAFSYDHLAAALRARSLPAKEEYVRAMSAAEAAHWGRVNEEQWSGPPTGLVGDGFRRLGFHAGQEELLAALDAYSRVVEGWTVVAPDAVDTLRLLRERDYRLGLLSNTWWASGWHDAELATHGLADLLDAVVYTSDLAHSKPHPSVFLEVTAQLGVEPEECVMVGDRMVDDVSGGLGAGMRAVWKRNHKPWPTPKHIVPTATIDTLSELPELLHSWGGA
jgi:putative hydrolase of the HAD superfamily